MMELGFFAGVTPAVLGITPYMGLNFAIYEHFKESFSVLDSGELPSSSGTGAAVLAFVRSAIGDNSILSTVLRQGLSGGIAGGIAKFLVYPLGALPSRVV